MAKKQKIIVDLTSSISHQNSWAPSQVLPVKAGAWDNVNLDYKISLNGLVLATIKDNPKLRAELEERVLARLNELLDAVTVE